MLAVARLFIGDRLNVEEMVEATAFVAESQAGEGQFLEGDGDGCGEWRLEISEEVKLEGSGTLDPVLDAVLDSGTEEVEEFERGVVGVEGGDRDETWASEQQLSKVHPCPKVRDPKGHIPLVRPMPPGRHSGGTV